MSEWIQNFVDTIKEVPSPIAFIILVLCSMIEYIFPIFPGDTVILLGGFLSGVNPRMLVVAFIATLVGTLLGSILAYFIGRFIRLKSPHYPLVKRYFFDSALFEKFEHWYKKYGWWIIVINRFLSGIRSIFIIACGFFNLSLVKTLIFTVISAVIYNAVLFAIGYFFGSHADILLTRFFHYSLILTLLFVTFLGSCFLYFMIKNHRKNK